MQFHESDEASGTQALSVVLQHPAVATDQQNICRLLQVCKAWRSAIRQSDACLMDVKISTELFERNDESLDAAMQFAPLLGQFAHWLSSYAGTVRSISLNMKGFESQNSCHVSTLRQISLDLIALGLRAAGQAIAVAAPSSSACSVAAYAMLPRPLKLQSFTCCSAMASPLIVSALPAATLTRLALTVPKAVQVHRALSSLSNLQSLDIRSSCDYSFARGYLSSINQLSRLTQLTLYSIPSTWDLTLLPQQLSQLDLRIKRVKDTLVNLTFAHLTALQRLRADLSCRVESASLPSQLCYLEIHCAAAVSAFNIRSMRQLQQLELGRSRDSPEDLIMLNQLQQLSHLVLSYNSSSGAAAAAPIWSQLQQLSVLDLHFSGSAAQMASVMDGCCQLTRLTQLLWGLTLEADEAADVEIAQNARTRISGVCQSLKHHTNLKELVIDLYNWVEVQQDDPLHLSSLTGLTSLWLRTNNLARSDCTIAVLLQLTQLGDLTLPGLKEIEVLPAIGQLKQLTHLGLPHLPKEVQQQGLKYLSKLRNLRELEGFDSCSKEVMKQFWADLQA